MALSQTLREGSRGTEAPNSISRLRVMLQGTLQMEGEEDRNGVESHNDGIRTEWSENQRGEEESWYVRIWGIIEIRRD